MLKSTFLKYKCLKVETLIFEFLRDMTAMTQISSKMALNSSYNRNKSL